MSGNPIDTICALVVRKEWWTQKKADEIAATFRSRTMQSFIKGIIENNYLPKGKLLSILSEYYATPSFDVTGYFFSRDLLHQIPIDVLFRHEVIPLQVEENILEVIASDPANVDLVSTLRNFVSYDIQVLVGIGDDIKLAVREFYDKAPTQVTMDSDLKQDYREEHEGLIDITEHDED